MSYISTILSGRRAFVLLCSAVCFLALIGYALTATQHAQAAGIASATAVTSNTDAGSHPVITMDIDFDGAGGKVGGDDDADSVRHMLISMPKGFIGNLNLLPRCPIDVFEDNDGSRDLNACDYKMHDTMLGELFGHVKLDLGGTIDINDDNGRIFNLEPEKGDLGAFGIHVFAWDGGPEMRIKARVYTDPNDNQRVIVDVKDTPRNLWGFDFYLEDLQFVLGKNDVGPIPILTMPTFCHEAGTIDLRSVDYNGNPSNAVTNLPTPTNCAGLKFDPRVSLTRDGNVNKVETPVKATVQVAHPRDPDPAVYSKSAVAGTTVNLPKGMELSPAVGEGLVSCTQADFDPADQTHPAACPDRSEIGTATIQTAEIDKPLDGKIFIGEVAKPNPDPQAKWGIEAKVYLEVAHPDAAGITWHGVKPHIPGDDWREPFRYKAVGELKVDRTTGQVTTSFGTLPGNELLPVKWDELALTLFASSNKRAALVNPRECSQSTQGLATFSPWSQAPTFAKKTDVSFGIDTVSFDGNPVCPSPRPYNPTFTARVIGDETAGQSPDGVELTINRSVRDDWLSNMTIFLPRGMLGKLGTLAPCPWAALDMKACPAQSSMGSLKATIGFGSDTLTLPGDIYYMVPDGSGNNVAMVLDAKVGPFDLGQVVIKGTFGLDGIGINQRIKFVVNNMPTRVAGIATPIQKVVATMEPSPGFFSNPVDCSVDRSFELQTTSAFDRTTTPSIKSLWKPLGGAGC